MKKIKLSKKETAEWSEELNNWVDPSSGRILERRISNRQIAMRVKEIYDYDASLEYLKKESI